LVATNADDKARTTDQLNDGMTAAAVLKSFLSDHLGPPPKPTSSNTPWQI
jgi:hypothetical protein